MKLLLTMVLLVLWSMSCSVLGNDKINDGAGPSKTRNDEEICMTNDNIEVLFNIIFGLNVNYDGNEWAPDILPERTLRELNVIHIIYRDQFRIMFNGVFYNNSISMSDLESRVVHFFQRVLLRMEEMLFEASRSAPNALTREIEYIVNVDECSIDFSFDCRLSAYNQTVDNYDYDDDYDEGPQHRCHQIVQSYRKNGCIVNTVKFAENSNQSLPWNSDSRLLDYIGRVMPLVLLSRLREQSYEYRMRNINLGALRSRLEMFFWIINFGTSEKNTSHRCSIRRGFNLDLERMILNNVYLENVMKTFFLSRQGIMIHVPDSNESDDDQDYHQDNDHESQQSYHLNVRWCINNLYKTFMSIFKRQFLNTTQRPGRSKRFVSTTTKPDMQMISQRIMEFTFVSLKDQTKANHHNKSLEWSKNFNLLYDQFLRKNWTNVLCPRSKFHGGFDNFIYFKFSQHPDWNECISRRFKISKWCSAVKHIIFKVDSKGQNLWLNGSPRPKKFLKDRTTVYKTMIEIPAMDLKSMMTNKSPKINDFYLNIGVFDLASIVLTFAQVHSCVENHRIVPE